MQVVLLKMLKTIMKRNYNKVVIKIKIEIV